MFVFYTTNRWKFRYKNLQICSRVTWNGDHHQSIDHIDEGGENERKLNEDGRKHTHKHTFILKHVGGMENE